MEEQVMKAVKTTIEQEIDSIVGGGFDLPEDFSDVRSINGHMGKFNDVTKLCFINNEDDIRIIANNILAENELDEEAFGPGHYPEIELFEILHEHVQRYIDSKKIIMV